MSLGCPCEQDLGVNGQVTDYGTRNGRCTATLRGHSDEILDVGFDCTGQRVLTASADNTACCYSAITNQQICKFFGHDGEISKITFNPQGTLVMTASADKTARLWDPDTGECKQVLEGHTDEIFSCAFNYEGNTIITGEIRFKLGNPWQLPCNKARCQFLNF
ncbi:dynein assembly factor with WDR repeat domains 1-like [Elysia marginata]|uniref:Dynein assembly factor with WDR repeat domains 1-like n=1 Tax=Elysia marginata TaxID=1093978 RepID=A0AAV4JAS1_9GAST|nr:dynein assembly factor with WDR repeat domains 1-like [Elysia marginata]